MDEIEYGDILPYIPYGSTSITISLDETPLICLQISERVSAFVSVMLVKRNVVGTVSRAIAKKLSVFIVRRQNLFNGFDQKCTSSEPYILLHSGSRHTEVNMRSTVSLLFGVIFLILPGVFIASVGGTSLVLIFGVLEIAFAEHDQ